MSGAADTEARTARVTLEPIGFVRAGPATKVEAARQPRTGGPSRARIELLQGRNFEHALDDLAGWEYLWVLFWFDRNRGWRPKVLPPRSRSGRKGVFATRSPHRPNPLGLSAVKLERVEGLVLHVADVDMLDGTPVLDIKPYVAYTDAIPEARGGWLADGAPEPRDPIAPFDVQWDSAAAEQAAWIEARTQLKLRARVTATLELGVEPHPYRRIRKNGAGFVLAVKEWRVRFDADGRRVQVREIASGFRESQLRDARDDLGVHREFRARYPAARASRAAAHQ
ncbi:MAG TPA: tRNA (N6-threonylcarbamoyladenosine(37)-N6)-methyltransferase TrmO [Gammaproteobacteria bacterium]|nr:tRNA (N6-threonylcarbamoyladenosine(37)-N6)-methyltransferase TrmO [Gammaproteobacteria bacterium]